MSYAGCTAHMSQDDVVASTVAPAKVPSRSTFPRAELPLLRDCRPVKASAATATYVAKPVPYSTDT